jgi:DNA-binding transcriptional regulator YdaS (Cro superfamily)
MAGVPAIRVGKTVRQAPVAGGYSQPAEEQEAKPKRDYQGELEGIAQRLETLANKQVVLKAPVEARWLRDIRLYHGKYDAALLASMKAGGQSTAFVKLARAKTVALEARIFDLMWPTDDRNWDAQATPVPKLSDELKEATTRATNAAQQATAAEAANDPNAQQIVAAGNDEAARAQAALNEIAASERAAKLMRDEMDDQLIESNYPSECRKGIHDFCQLGPMILKGPMVNEKTRGRWMPVNRPDNQVPNAAPHDYELKQHEDKRPLIRRVDPWNFFPDMAAGCPEEREFDFERYLWTASDLRRMVKTNGFDPDAVRDLLREDVHKSNRVASSASLMNLVLLRSLTDDKTSGQITGRYVGWEYHGPLECDEVCTILRAMGKDSLAEQYELENDPLREFRVIVHFCQGRVLKLSPEWPLDSGESLYSIANLEDAEGQLFGYGIPAIMADSSDALNAAWRMALDNGALSTGPQCLIAKDEIEPADGSWTFSPRKIWNRIKAGVPHAPQSIQFFDVPNNMEELQLLIELATRFIDMETGIPQPQAGEEAKSTPTVGGLAILQSSANIIFRRIIKNLDDGIVAPTMRRLYDWNMQFSKRAEIKGDMQIDARGTSVLLVKEVQAQNLMLVVTNLMQNPTIAPMIKAYPAIEKLFQSMMIKPSEVLISEDDYKKHMDQMAQQPAPPSPQEIMANAQLERAKIAAESSKLSNETQKLIAQLREHTALIELAAKGEISMEELRTDLQKTDLTNQHKERLFMAEAAVDRQNADDARAHGEEPGGSGGSTNAGVESKKAA